MAARQKTAKSERREWVWESRFRKIFPGLFLSKQRTKAVLACLANGQDEDEIAKPGCTVSGNHTAKGKPHSAGVSVDWTEQGQRLFAAKNINIGGHPGIREIAQRVGRLAHMQLTWIRSPDTYMVS